jgi:hypothetical protein
MKVSPDDADGRIVLQFEHYMNVWKAADKVSETAHSSCM